MTGAPMSALRMFRPDSAQLASIAGTSAAFFGGSVHQWAGTACALAGLAYTLWRWRREARRPDPEK